MKGSKLKVRNASKQARKRGEKKKRKKRKREPLFNLLRLFNAAGQSVWW